MRPIAFWAGAAMRDQAAPSMSAVVAILAILSLPLAAGVVVKAVQNAAFETVNADRYDENGEPRW